MGALRKLLKALAFAYFAAFLFASAHFPMLIKRSFFEVPRLALLLPFSTIGIVRAYGQFVLAGTWPFGSRPNVVLLDDQVASHGVDPFTGSRFTNSPLRRITFDHRPELGPGQQGHTFYELGTEEYGRTYPAAFPGLQGGGLLRIGRYFCLMSSARGIMQKMVGPSRCYELILRPGNQYYWRALGEETEKPVRLID